MALCDQKMKNFYPVVLLRRILLNPGIDATERLAVVRQAS